MSQIKAKVCQAVASNVMFIDEEYVLARVSQQWMSLRSTLYTHVTNANLCINYSFKELPKQTIQNPYFRFLLKLNCCRLLMKQKCIK